MFDSSVTGQALPVPQTSDTLLLLLEGQIRWTQKQWTFMGIATQGWHLTAMGTIDFKQPTFKTLILNLYHFPN